MTAHFAHSAHLTKKTIIAICAFLDFVKKRMAANCIPCVMHAHVWLKRYERQDKSDEKGASLASILEKFERLLHLKHFDCAKNLISEPLARGAMDTCAQTRTAC